MRLREKVKVALQARLAAHLPEALSTAWDVDAVIVMVESLTFSPSSGFKGDWERRAHFEGVIRAELKSDGIDDLELDLLIAALVKRPLFVTIPGLDDIPPGPGDVVPIARLKLLEMRDTVRDQMVVSALRFEVTGQLCAYSPDPGRPTGQPEGVDNG